MRYQRPNATGFTSAPLRPATAARSTSRRGCPSPAIRHSCTATTSRHPAKQPFLRLDLGLVRQLGPSPALLLVYLRYIASRQATDPHGYFSVDSGFIAEALGFTRKQQQRARSALIAAGLLDYLPGKNQNTKSRFKLL